MNKISVIIPTYEHAPLIKRCLEWVVAQSRKADEIIVVDDGCVDGTSVFVKFVVL